MCLYKHCLKLILTSLCIFRLFSLYKILERRVKTFVKVDPERTIVQCIQIWWRECKSYFVAEHLSTRYLILQYSLAVHCVYVSHALECNYNWVFPLHRWWSLVLRALYLVWNVERSWPCFKNEGRGERDGRETRRQQARMHQQTSRAHKTSQWRSVNYDNRCLA